MGTPKGDLVLDGVRLVDRAIATLRSGGCEPVIAVVRAGVSADGAVVNPDPARGLRSSLEIGIDATEVAGTGAVEAVAVLLADLPGVSAQAVASVCAAWRPGRITVAVYDGVRGHPIVMEPRLWREAIAMAEPDEGARALQRARPDLVDEVGVDGDPVDLDTPADVDRWRAREA